MAFCVNCGYKHEENDKFCTSCGTQAVVGTINKTERKQEYSGIINKCPSCGEVLSALVANCPACGHELRGTKVSETVQEFFLKVERAETEQQKSDLIRTFPIPNSKEDIFEFMIMALTNQKNETRTNLSDAWAVKIDQSYYKAKLVFGDDNDFNRIQTKYDQLHKITINKRQNDKTKKIALLICYNASALLGIALFIWAIIIDNTGGNSSFHEIIGAILLIVSAATLAKRGSSYIDYIVGGCSGILSFFLATFLRNGSMLQLVGGIVLVIVFINFIRKVIKDNKGDRRQ